MISKGSLFYLSAIAPLVFGQQRGTITPEVHPSLTTYQCSKSGGCSTNTNTKVVLDANWRWLHGPAPNNKNCFSGSWDSSLCPDPDTCAKNCALEGADYSGTYGITTSGQNLELKLFPSSGAVGSRVYLLGDDENYQLLKLLGKELSFDVDMSQVPCGANGALYLTSMPKDGGMSASANNKAGAKYGTGYCDAQCPHDIKFINGQANTQSRYGSCCPEFDVWEANSAATAFTAHPCTKQSLYRCDNNINNDCGICDQPGCDFNAYRMGNQTFYGPGRTVATDQGNIRVVTQFITNDGTSTGTLSEIRRMYVRNGKIISNASSKIPNVNGNSLSDSYCAAEKSAFGESNIFQAKGGMAGMGTALANGMALTMSIWVDYSSHMNWLDSTFPEGATGPGSVRGPCSTTSGDPNTVRQQYPNAKVTFSNIRVGDIGTTY